jgi:hypothetical protein
LAIVINLMVVMEIKMNPLGDGNETLGGNPPLE